MNNLEKIQNKNFYMKQNKDLKKKKMIEKEDKKKIIY